MLTLNGKIISRAARLVATFGLALVLGAVVTMSASGQTPPNDNLANAQPILGSAGVIYGDNMYATAETNEPPPFNNPAQATIWYLWTAPVTTTMDFSTRYSTDPDGNELGTVMAVYTAPIGFTNLVFSNLTLVASNQYDPSAGTTNGQVTSRVDFPVTVGQEYLIQIDGTTNALTGTIDEGTVELNWSPSLVGGTFAFSATSQTGCYMAGEYDDILPPPMNMEPQSLDPSLHDSGTRGTNNVRITVTRQGGYMGRCEVTLLVTNSYYTNMLYTNFTGTNIYITNYNTNGAVLSYTNFFQTNIASENLLEDLVQVGLYPQLNYVTVYGLTTVAQTNGTGLPALAPTTNVFSSLTNLAIQTNFLMNFPCQNQTTVSGPVTNGSIITVTTTQYFCSSYSTSAVTTSASNRVDYAPYSNVLVFNDFQMSKDVYLQINPKLVALNGPDWPDTNGRNLYKGINPYLLLTLTNAVLDPLEDADITPPTISPAGSNAYLGILTFEGNPFYSTQAGPYLTTNTGQYVTINLERATFRVNRPAPVSPPNLPPASNNVYLYAVLTGSPSKTDQYTVNYTIDNATYASEIVGTPTSDVFRWNGFPTVAGSDYAQSDHYGVTDADFGDPLGDPPNEQGRAGVGGGNTTWSGGGTTASGTFTIGPGLGNGNTPAGEICIPIFNWGATEFDVDMVVNLFLPATNTYPNLSQSVPGVIGNINSANLTINFSGIEPGGAYDVSYNPAGQSTASFPPYNPTPGANPPPASGGVVEAVAIQPDGKAVIGGYFTSYNTTPVYSIARLLTNGWLDTSFNNVRDGGVDGYVTTIVIDTNGNIIIGGDFSSYDGNLKPTLNIARLLTDGTLDATFNTGMGFDGAVNALALDANGNILVGGDFTHFNTTNCNHIARLLPNGALDTTFLPDTGNGLTNFGTDQSVQAVAIDGNGNIVLGGDFNLVNGTSMNYLARLLPTGAVDTTFNNQVGPDSTVFSVAIEPNNEIVIGGAFQNYNLRPSGGVALIGTNGALDTTFPVGSGADGIVYTVGLQPDGCVLVGGQFRNFNSTRRLGVARLLSNGWVDTSFMDTSYNQFAGLINSFYSATVDPVHVAYALAVQPDGNIIVGGSFTNIGGGTARNAIATQINVTRLIGAPTPGPMTGGGGINNCPGNITLTQNPYTVNDTSGKLYLTLDRVNGSLGPAQVTIGTNTYGSGTGSATAKDFGLILSQATPLYNIIGAHWFVTPAGSYGWRKTDAYWNYNILPAGGPNALNPGFSDLGDSTVNVNIYDDLQAQQNLLASFSLLNITELGITNPTSRSDGPIVLGGVVIPTFPALGTPGAQLEIINTHFPVGFVGFSATNFTAINTSNTVTITVLRTNGISGPINVTCSTANGSALAGSNYTTTTRTLIFSGGPNNNTATFTIPILNNSTLQSTKYFKLYLTNASIPGVLDTNVPPILPTTATVTIIDGNFKAGHLDFTSPTYSVTKGGVATISVQRIGGGQGQLTVRCATSNSTAINGVNYVGATNTLSWDDQDVSNKTMTVQTLQDNVVDGNMTVNLNLFNATNVGSTSNDSLILYSPSNAVLTIVESDYYGNLNFAAPNYNVLQNAGQAVITVVRSIGITGTISVQYSVTDDTSPPQGFDTAHAGTHYGATNGTLVLGQGVTSASFAVPIYYTPGEASPANRVATLTLYNGSSNISGQFPQYATLTILDPQLIQSAAGAVDTTTQNGIGFNNNVNSLAFQPDGNILAGGNFTFFNQYPFEYVARLNGNASYDSSFLLDQSGASGQVFQVIAQRTNNTQTNNGPLLIAGDFTTVDGVTRNGLARLNIDGSVDETFNPGSGADSTIFTVAQTFLPTGVAGKTNVAFYIGGNFANFGSVPSGGIARINASSNSPGYQGAVDPNFSVGQGVTSGAGAVHALAIQADNSVIAGGNFTSFNSATHNHLVRLNSAGVVDATFNASTGSNAVDSVQAIAIQPDGRILVGGSFTNVTVSNVNYNLNYLARFNADGSLDTNFNAGLGGNNTVLALAVDSQQKILVGGAFSRFSGVTRSGITRLNPDGTVDPTINFGSGADGGIVNTIIIEDNDEIDVGGGFTSFERISEGNYVRLYGGANAGNGSILFSSAAFGAVQNQTNAAVTLQRLGGEGASNQPPVTIVFSTSDGTALAGTDYTSVTTNVTFPVGETFVTVPIPVFNNYLVTSNRYVNLNLSSPTNTVIGTRATARLIITNNNTAVQFSASAFRQSANAPGGYADIQVQRIGNPNTIVTVTVYTGTNGTATPGINYMPQTNVLTFNPNVTNLDFLVPILNASNMFSDQTVDLELGQPSNAFIASPGSATLTISHVYSGPGVLSFLQTNYSVSEGATNAIISIIRTNGSSGPVSVVLSTSNNTAMAGTNYVPINTTVNFADGVTNQNVYIPVIQLTNAVPDVTLYLNLSNSQPPAGQGGPTIGSTSQAILTILNDIEDFAFAQTSYFVTEGTVLNVTILRGGIITNTATVSFHTYSPPNASESNGLAVPNVDYLPATGTLTYASNVIQQSVPITIPQGNVVNGPLTFQVILSNPSTSNQSTILQIAPPTTNTITIFSDLTVYEFPTNSYTVAQNGSNLVITVYRINTATPAGSVRFGTSDGTNQNPAFNAVNKQDYVATNGTLNFGIGQTMTNFTVSILNSNLVQSNKTFYITLSNALVGSTAANLGSPSTAAVTITNVYSGVSFSSTNYSLSDCATVQASIPVQISGATNQAISVFYGTSNGTGAAGYNYVATNGTLFFAPGQTTTNIYVQLINNHVSGPDLTFYLSLSNPVSAQLLSPSNASFIIHECNGFTNFVVTPFASSAFFTWGCQDAAAGQVAYGLTTNYGSVTSLSGLSTNHLFLLTGLARDTVYYFSARSWEDGSLYTTNGTFTTVDTLILNTYDASYSGLWTAGAPGMPGCYGSYFNETYTTPFNPTAWAIFAPTIPTPGLYNVFTWFPPNNTFSSNTWMFVSGGTNEIIETVNQTTNGGCWQPLATNLYFAVGNSGNVVIYNDTGESNRLVVANAMKWSYVTNQDCTPGAVPAWWSWFYYGSGTAGACASNYANYVLGTSPTDPSCKFNFWVTCPAPNTLTAHFSPCMGGRLYAIQSATNLSNPRWQTLTNQPTADTNGCGAFSITQTNAAQFFRISAQVPPQ